MATHDYIISNQSGASFRTDLNNALAAIVSNNSNSSSPSTTYAYQWWADTNAAILKIRNSSNNAWINLFTLAGGINVASASTFTDDVSMQGASGKDINFDASAGTLTFKDNTQAHFGTGSDIKLFHDGGNAHFANTTGTFKIKGDNIHLQKADGSEDCLTTAANGAVGAFFDDSLKLSTVSGGIQVHNIANNNGILLSGTGNNTAVIFTSTADSPDNGYRLSFHSVSATRHNDEYLAIDKTDTSGTGGIDTITTFTVGGQHFDDNKKIHLGGTAATGDLQLYHNGTNSFISNTTGNLQIDSDAVVQINATEFKIKNAADTSTMARFFQDSVITLMFNGVERLKVDNTLCAAFDNSGGTSGEGRIGFGNSGMPFIKALDTGNHGSGSLFQIYDGDGDLQAQFLRNAGSSLYHDGSPKIITQSNGMTMANDSAFRMAKETSTSGSVTVIQFQKDNPTNNVGSVTIDNSSATFNTSSDYRLKENERPIDDAIEKVKLLKPYYFNFIETPEKESQGFFAHEVMDYVPTAVKGKKDEVALNGMPIYQELDYSKIVPMLTAGLKALIDKVEKLEAT